MNKGCDGKTCAALKEAFKKDAWGGREKLVGEENCRRREGEMKGTVQGRWRNERERGEGEMKGTGEREK